MAPPTANDTQPRRRWYQYGLRSLLLLMFAVAVFFGWLGSQRRAYRTQRQALDALEKLGVDVVLKTKESPLLRKLIGKDYVQVIKVSFHDNQKLKNDDLQPLGKLLELKELSLHGCSGIGDEGLRHFQTLTGLRRLSLHGTGIKGAGLIHLRAMTELRTLSLQTTSVGDGLRHLSELKKLEALNLTQVRAGGVVRIASFPQLKTLKLRSARGITRLELEDLPKLNDLYMSSIGADKVRAVGLPRLTTFTIGFYYLGDTSRCELHLEDLPNVESLNLYGPIDQLRLRGLPSVKSLEAEFNPICDQEFADLGTLSQLEHVEFFSQIDRLPLARWPRLKTLGLYDTKTGDDGLRGLETLGCLDELHLNGVEVGEATTKRIVQLANLRRLNLSSTKIDAEAAAHIAHAASLEELNLVNSGLTDQGLVRLMGMPNLRGLFLQGNPVTCRNIAWDLPRLQHLGLQDTKVTDDALRGVATLPRLRELSLNRNPQITDAGMRHLKGRKFSSLWLDGTSVTKRP